MNIGSFLNLTAMYVVRANQVTNYTNDRTIPRV